MIRARELLFVSLLTLAGCAAPAPPARTSPALEPLEIAALDGVRVSSRGGVSLAWHGESGSVLAIDADGMRDLYTGVDRTLTACVIAEHRGVRVAEHMIEIFDGDAVHHAIGIDEAFGGPIDVVQPRCSALSLDEVWIQIGSRLAHWDGEGWSAETLELELPWAAGLSVTEQHLYVNAADGVYRRPRSGGAFELVAPGGYDRIVRDVDASRAGVLVVDMYDFVLRAEVLGDDGERTVLTVDGATAGYVSSEQARFDRTGALWAGVLLTEGETETSFGGSTSFYFPDWYQVIAYRTDAAGTLVELGHHDHVYETREVGPEPLLVIPAGEGALFGFRDELLRLAD